MYKIYKLFSYILIPIIVLNLYLRLIFFKEEKHRTVERYGYQTKQKNKSKKLIWIHAASVGEFKSSSIIIQKYAEDYQILITTTTKSAADFVKANYSNLVTHQYLPFDVPIWCERFLTYWKPKLVIWIESDLWPNILESISKKKIKCIYLNARISPKSFNKWKHLKSFYTLILKNFYIVFAQSPDDLRRINSLSNREINFIGNLKLAKIKSDNPKIVKNRDFTLMIASTHQNEEILILKEIKDFLIDNNIKIYIAPRHPIRTRYIIKDIERIGLSVVTEKYQGFNSSNIVLIDSLGNLEKYFKLSDIVVLGGSFTKTGGHNPMEPALHNCAIISGPNVFNWRNIFEDMKYEEACIIVNNYKEVLIKILDLFNNRKLLDNLKHKSFEFSNKIFFEDSKLFDEIDLAIK